MKKINHAKNKTVHRKDNKKGEFTTISYAILRDNRLTPNAKLLLIEILSDTDNFKFSEQLYMNRLNITSKTFYRATANLIENGYLKKTKIKDTNYNYYTVSEYGNLNGNTQAATPENKQSVKAKVQAYDKATMEKIAEHLAKYENFVDEPFVENCFDMMDAGQDYYAIKSEVDRLIKQRKTAYFNEVKTQIMESMSNQNVKTEAVKLLKAEVFDNNNKPEANRMRTRASQNINRRKPLDEESLWADKMDGI